MDILQKITYWLGFGGKTWSPKPGVTHQLWPFVAFVIIVGVSLGFYFLG